MLDLLASAPAFPAPKPSLAMRLATGAVTACIAACIAAIAGCGSGDAPPPAEVATTPVQPVTPTPPAPVAPTITQQPASVTTPPGPSATFTVAATGTAPLTYRWQRNGADITGATQASYTLPTTVLADSGATFRAIVSNVAGSATSNSATLTITVAAPVLSITPQPANTTVAAGASASFTVGGTCSSGTVLFQWQRLIGSVFTDIGGATSATYSFMTAAADNGAQFRAVLSCGGASAAPSSTATLTVTTPSAVTLSLLPVTGLRDQAPIGATNGIEAAPGGGWDFTSTHAIRHLSADLSTITLVAGGPASGHDDGPAATATFNLPQGLVHDATGTIYVADTGNQTIRRIATDGSVSTIAGSALNYGYVDGTGAAAQFNNPTAIAVGPDGDLYVTDDNNGAIRRVTTAGVVTTFADPSMKVPYWIAAGSDGALWVTDLRVRSIYRLSTAGQFTRYRQKPFAVAGQIIPGPDGALWFADRDTLGHLTTTGRFTSIDTGGLGVSTLADGPDGGVWFTNTATIARYLPG